MLIYSRSYAMLWHKYLWKRYSRVKTTVKQQNYSWLHKMIEKNYFFKKRPVLHGKTQKKLRRLAFSRFAVSKAVLRVTTLGWSNRTPMPNNNYFYFFKSANHWRSKLLLLTWKTSRKFVLRNSNIVVYFVTRNHSLTVIPAQKLLRYRTMYFNLMFSVWSTRCRVSCTGAPLRFPWPWAISKLWGLVYAK